MMPRYRSNVKVEGSSGFDANVDDWEDEVNSDIDI